LRTRLSRVTPVIFGGLINATLYRLNTGPRLISTLLLWATISLWFATLAVRQNYDGLLSDGYVYLLMADGFSFHGASGHRISLDYLFSHYAFPPLFPFVLAVTGAAKAGAMWVFALNSCILGLAIVLFSRLYQLFGLSTFAATALAISFALLPATWLTALDVQSEPLYLLLTAGALIALCQPSRSAKSWLIAGLCCGMAVLTRTVGISLLLVFFCCYFFSWWRTGRSAGITPALAAIGPLVAWTVFRAVAGFDATYTDSHHEFLRGSPAAIMRVAMNNAHALWFYAVRSFDLMGNLYTQITVGGFTVLAGIELARRCWRGDADAFYVLVYLAVILCWPYPNHARRFLLMVLPLLLGYAVVLLSRVCTTYISPRAGQGIAASAIAMFILLSAPSTAQMLIERSNPDMQSLAQRPARYQFSSYQAARFAATYMDSVFALARRGRELIPPDACVSATLPDYLMFHARRTTLDLKLSVDKPDDLHRQLTQCPYVFMVGMASVPSDGTAPLYPFALLRSRFHVLATARGDPANPKSPTVAMWARYRTAKNP
jgi:hypothetical protein